MKKILLLSASACFAISSYAQQVSGTIEHLISTSQPGQVNEKPVNDPGTSDKTTATGDTLQFHGNAEKVNGPFGNLNADYAQPFDSGKLYGISVLGLKGFAQLYQYRSINADATKDTTYRIIGIVSRWHGTIQTSSTKQIGFNVWTRNTQKVSVPNRPKFFVYGVPGTSLASRTVNATNVAGQSITNSGGAVVTYLTTPLTGVNQDVYVGYTTSYTWGSLGNDTFGLRNTQTGTTNLYTVDGNGDSLTATFNLVQENGGNWVSTRYNLGITNGGDQVIYPMIQMDCPTCWPSTVNGVTNQNLTFHGNYPNPAVNNTTVVFSLGESADVTIELLDVTGRTIERIVKNGLAKGENEVRIETSSLPAGTYIYTLESSKGGAVASQFTVAK